MSSNNEIYEFYRTTVLSRLAEAYPFGAKLPLTHIIPDLKALSQLVEDEPKKIDFYENYDYVGYKSNMVKVDHMTDLEMERFFGRRISWEEKELMDSKGLRAATAQDEKQYRLRLEWESQINEDRPYLERQCAILIATLKELSEDQLIMVKKPQLLEFGSVTGSDVFEFLNFPLWDCEFSLTRLGYQAQKQKR